MSFKKDVPDTIHKDRRIYLLLFLIPFSVAMLYALFTDHRWEDWYITYRASKNLALGHGLTYTAGEKVYSYTSPINTLLPALFAYVFPHNADQAAIWLYRLVNSVVLGICAMLLWRLAGALQLNRFFSFFLIALFSVNILIIDNSINGMEAPYMMLFLILLIFQLYKKEQTQIRDFILPFTGLMYTRPDGFVYAAFLIAGFLVFHFNRKDPKAQFPFVAKLLRAALIALALYLPWILVTWYYYGSPIPNTIIAKSVFKDYDLWVLIKEFIKFPFTIFRDTVNYVLSGLFMPGYSFFGGWYQLEWPGRLITTITFYAFLFPFLPKAARAFSLSVYLAVFYLTVVSGQGGQPWYLPNLSIQAILFLAVALNALYEKYRSNIIPGFASVFFAYSFVLLLLGGYSFKMQQEIVENGNRTKIGQWLKANASKPNETVFLECLGYIGYYSNLKMYDFPGMSSPEVVGVLRKNKAENKIWYSVVIDSLKPDWVVLRPWEIDNINREMPGMLDRYYEREKNFSVIDQIPDQWYLLGKPYLENDAWFVVFKKRSMKREIDHTPELVYSEVSAHHEVVVE